MDLERIFALLSTYENNSLINDPSFYGIIHHYIHWGYSFDNYKNDLENDKSKLDKYSLIKVWSGR
jgi:hypothetical protein